MKMTRTCILSLAAILLACTCAGEPAMENGPAGVRYGESALDSMAIVLAPGSGRPYMFSGTGTSFFYGTTETVAADWWMGFHWRGRKLFDDWVLVAGDRLKDRERAEVTVRPDAVRFRWPDGIELSVTPQGVARDDLRFRATGAEPGEELALYFVFPEGVAVERAYAKKARGIQYFLLDTAGDSVFVALGSSRWFEPREMRPATGVSPGNYSVHSDKPIHGAAFDEDSLDITFTYGESAQAAGDRWVEIRESGREQARLRREWLLGEINRAAFRCDNERVNRAVNWAKVSLAMLFAEDETLLWAGLPWFSEGWGRDTFISLPGACLVHGKFGAAEKILRRFAKWQHDDPQSPDYGKIPNRARPDEIIYNTADGTPWFVRELYEYGLYSGDRELWADLRPVIERAMAGAIEHRVDSLGLLTHGDADTWMDARAEHGPWSPRGDRAVEIQALWCEQIAAARAMLGAVDPLPAGEPPRWRGLQRRLVANFRERFVRADRLGLYDHLDPGGSPDRSIRPNQLFALTVPLAADPLVTPEVAEQVVRTVRDSLVYPWGVGSLAPADERFLAYHHSPDYPKDAAYHNGIVWTWLSGPYKTASRRGWAIAENEIDQILDRGCAGTLSENLDARPRPGNAAPDLSGTITQAWSLAEFLRAIYQDYLGLRPAPGAAGGWLFDPRQPREWGNVRAVVWIDGSPLLVESKIERERVAYEIRPLDPDRELPEIAGYNPDKIHYARISAEDDRPF